MGLLETEKCKCWAFSSAECACGAWSTPTPQEQLETFANNLEQAASLAAIYRLGYTKGFSDAELLKAFCGDYAPQPYFPTADNRPTAERLEWPALS